MKRTITLLTLLLLAFGTLLVTSIRIFDDRSAKHNDSSGTHSESIRLHAHSTSPISPGKPHEKPQEGSPTGHAGTTENIHLALLFNDMHLQNPQELVGKIQYLWGPSGNRPINTSIYTSAYVPSSWPALRNSFDWWKANHPDWIVYKCDKTTPAFVPTHPDTVPLDISNPAVRDFQMKTYNIPFLRLGNNSIGFDNVLVENYMGACGVWRNGVWIPLYSGTYHDPVYANVVLNWAKEMYTRIHQYSPSAGVAFNMAILASPASYRQLAPYTDIIVDEGGLTNFGTAGKNYITDNQWLVQIQTIQNIVKLGKGFILNAYEPEMSYHDISSQEVQWDLSNYLLIKGDHTFTYVSVNPSSQVWRTFSDRQEYHVLIGHPTSDMYSSQGVYMRRYSNGLAIVNPSSTNSYHLNFPRPYKNIEGSTITSYTIGVHSGLILLTQTEKPLSSTLMQSSTQTVSHILYLTVVISNRRQLKY